MVARSPLERKIGVRVPDPQQMKIYITGVSGTGKSAIAKELEKRGIFAFSIDEVDGLCNWVDRKSQKVDNNYIPSNEWLDAHDWICDIEKLKKLLVTDKDLVIATGISTNQDEYLDLFDKIFLLQSSKEVFMSRIENRHKNPGENTFGKNLVEREYAAAIHKDFDGKLLNLGAESINAESSIDMVVDEILSKI